MIEGREKYHGKDPIIDVEFRVLPESSPAENPVQPAGPIPSQQRSKFDRQRESSVGPVVSDALKQSNQLMKKIEGTMRDLDASSHAYDIYLQRTQSAENAAKRKKKGSSSEQIPADSHRATADAELEKLKRLRDEGKL